MLVMSGKLHGGCGPHRGEQVEVLGLEDWEDKRITQIFYCNIGN